MGTIISYFSLSKLYQNLIDFHHSIDGNWFLYLNFLIKSLAKKPKSRFDLYDVDIDGDPYAIGLLPPKQEWVYECPQTNKSENLLIYGTNSWGQYLIIEIKWRPQNNNKINANVRLLFKDENQVIYELNENDLLTIESNNKLKQYKIAGLTVQVVSPYRKLRIRVRGLLRRKDTNELVYSRFRLFWSAVSNIFDFQNDFDDKYIAKELSALGVSEFKAEDRHEQWGQMIGSIQFGNENSKEVFLWGNKSKQYFDNQFKRKVTRIYGYDSKSFSFHVGTVRSNHNFKLQYGYVSAGNGSVYPMSGISSTFSELESIGINDSSLKKFKIEIKEQLREYDIEIGDQIDKYDDLVIYDMKLNGHNGKCLVIHEDFNENVNNFSKVEFHDKLSEGLVVPINDIKAKNVMLSGGKGGSLAALTELANDLELKFSVPKGLIVTTNAYKQLIEESELISNGIDKLEKLAWSEKRENLKKYCQEFSELFAKQEMSKTLIENLTNNLRTIFGHNFESIRFAVRSSALSEDSGEMSSAGQMTTILGVKGLPSIIKAVMECWSSQFAFVAVEYKRGYGQEINSPMAVVIQEMINSETAGVIFTCDPITGDERNILITANYGIGESVVSALAEPDTIKLSVNIESNSLLNKRMIQGIESIEIGSKQKSIVLNDNNESGTKGLTNSTQRNECCLSEDQCRELAEIALDVHRSYGDPRDIEWGIKDNRIYLLQSRPITNLDNWTEWEAMHDIDSGQQSESEYFSRANLGEVFPGATSHLSLSYIINTWNANGFRNWRKMFRLPKKEYTAYYNRGGGIINNHYFFLLKTGGFPFVGDPKSTFSKSIQIGLFGHEFGEEFDDLIKDSNEKAPKKSFPLHFKIWLFFGSIKYFLTPGVTLRDAINKMSGLNIFRGKIDFTAKDIFYSLLKSYHLTGPISYAHGKVSMCSMMYNMFLLEILKKNNPNNENDCYSDFSQLVSSANQVVSAQVPNILRDIANSIKDRQKFRQMSDEKALKYLLYSESEASKKFKEFLLEYGHRGYKEFDLFVSQWGDNPFGIIKSLKTMLNGDQILRQTKRDKSIDEIISSLKSPLTKTSKYLLKYLIIPWTQSGIKFREQGKHCLTWTQNVYRHAFWRLAKQMVSEGRLPDPELMFHMTLEELQILLEERDPTMIGRARIRRKVHPIKDSFKFPETTIGPKIRARNEMSETISEPINGELARIRGTPVSAGKIKGRCCVAMTLEEAQNIQSGDILITYSTDIGWSPYFPMLSGLATEIGGLISHGAVIAREYGLPCLVGVEGAHRLFKTGDTIVIDSNIGEIYKIE